MATGLMSRRKRNKKDNVSKWRERNINISRLFNVESFSDSRGNTAFIPDKQIGFPIKRVYYLYDTPHNKSRGQHAHMKEHQILIALHGSFNVLLDNGKAIRTFNLNTPTEALYVAPKEWREIYNFSEGAVCLAIVDDYYNEKEMIRDYKEFKRLVASQ